MIGCVLLLPGVLGDHQDDPNRGFFFYRQERSCRKSRTCSPWYVDDFRLFWSSRAARASGGPAAVATGRTDSLEPSEMPGDCVR